ncbi:MAG TPA: DotU family type IV/VI secretion system protein [Polyangia bacterium]|jgi:type VI secretion system protein ImpK|nr:DotU family type IV/VI secretion system protein [Polyangia bacterium]
MDVVNQITSECFNAVTRLREVDGPVSSPDLIHDRMRGFIDVMRERARELGMSQRDADDVVYAVVALIDEIAMGKPEPMRGFWVSRPLQLHYFHENLAGEGFFQRLEEIRRDPRRGDVLRVYYICLLLGFQGRFGIRGGEIELLRLIDQMKPEVERSVEPPDVLSPAGEAPDEPLVRASKRNPFLWIALGVFAVAITVFIGLRVSLDHDVNEIRDRVDSLKP